MKIICILRAILIYFVHFQPPVNWTDWSRYMPPWWYGMPTAPWTNITSHPLAQSNHPPSNDAPTAPTPPPTDSNEEMPAPNPPPSPEPKEQTSTPVSKKQPSATTENVESLKREVKEEKRGTPRAHRPSSVFILKKGKAEKKLKPSHVKKTLKKKNAHPTSKRGHIEGNDIVAAAMNTANISPDEASFFPDPKKGEKRKNSVKTRGAEKKKKSAERVSSCDTSPSLNLNFDTTFFATYNVLF